MSLKESNVFFTKALIRLNGEFRDDDDLKTQKLKKSQSQERPVGSHLQKLSSLRVDIENEIDIYNNLIDRLDKLV